MWLYVDDLRTPRNTGMVVARDYDAAIMWLKTGNVSYLSLDHDLGVESRHDAITIVDYMVEHGITVPEIHLHTANPVGRDNMIRTITRWELTNSLSW